MSTDNVDSLTAVIPDVKTRIINGKTISITHFKMLELPHVMSAVQPFIHLFKASKNSKADIQSALMDYSSEAMNLIAAMSGQSRAWVEELEIDEGIMLALELIEVNIDFFATKVLPMLTSGIESMTKKTEASALIKNMVGRINSNDSSTPVTTTTQS